MPGEIGDALSEYTFADDAQARTREVGDRMREEAELARALPRSGDHVIAVGNDAPPQREDQGERVLRHRVDRVLADVRDRDPALPAVCLVDAVGTGRGDGDEAQIRKPSRRRPRPAAPC